MRRRCIRSAVLGACDESLELARRSSGSNPKAEAAPCIWRTSGLELAQLDCQVRPCRLHVVRKAIREFLENKLRALKQAKSEGATGRDLPGRILFGPPPKDAVEARLHGILEGLYAAGKINGREASDWHSRFRSVLAVPGDPGTVVGYVGEAIPADVRTQLERSQPWPTDSMILAIEPDIPARDYDTGLLALTRVELYPLGWSLNWRLDLSEDAQARIQKARKDLKKSPPDLLEFHLTRTLLPSVHAMSMSDGRTAASLLDMDSNFFHENQIRAITRLTPPGQLPAQVTVVWAGRNFSFSIDNSKPNA